MNAILIELLTPMIPLIRYIQTKDREGCRPAPLELALRYALYTFANVLGISLIMLFLSKGDISVVEKFDRAPGFAVKFLLLEALMTGLVTLADQILLRYQVTFQAPSSKTCSRAAKILCVSLLPLLSLAVLWLNGSLILDHVLWGDEAFSVNTADNGIQGIMQILHFWDNHPPLYYLWLHLLISLFGSQGFVYHLSAFLPFAIGILLACTALRRHFGAISAALFVLVSGLAETCLQYNQEVRMYALALLCLTLCYYCSYLVMKGSKIAWFFMVFFGLAAAYSHYYALAAAGILLFFTGAAYFVRYGGRTFLPGVLAVLFYIAGYLPWVPELLYSMQRLSGSWWITEIPSPGDVLPMLAGGDAMGGVLLPLFVLLVLAVLILDCRLIRLDIREAGEGSPKGHLVIRLASPSMQGWSDCTYSCVVGLMTLVGTVVFAYLLCVLTRPFLDRRYLYPLCGVFVMTFIMAYKRLREWLGEHAPQLWRPVLLAGCRYCMLAVCGVLLVVGLRNFKEYQAIVKMEKTGTEETLSLIGEPEPSVAMAAFNVRHLSWTILQHYYPGHEVLNESCESVEADAFWYFSGTWLSEEQSALMGNRGYVLYGYGEHRISQYPFILYYFEREK